MAKVGRPNSKNPRNMTIPEARVTKGEYWMVQLKAAQYGMSVAELMRTAVAQYSVKNRDQQFPLCKDIFNGIRCNGSFEHVSVSHPIHFEIDDRSLTITVQDVPAHKCSSCGTLMEDIELGAKLEECVSDLVDTLVNSRNFTFPTVIHYQNLLDGTFYLKKLDA